MTDLQSDSETGPENQAKAQAEIQTEIQAETQVETQAQAHPVSAWFRRTFADPQMVLLVVVVALAFLGIMLFAQMLAPAIAAVVIAFLLDGPVKWLERRGVPQLLAIPGVFIGFLALSTVILLSVVPPLVTQIAGFINESPAMVESLTDLLLELQQRFPAIVTEAQVESWLAQIGAEIGALGPRILQYSLSGLTGTVTMIVYLVLVPLMVFFFLKDKREILAWAASFLPAEKPIIEQVWGEVVGRAGDYARGKIYEILIMAVSAFVIYQLIGLRYATLLAVATGLSVIIPYIGAAAVTLPIALVGYFQWGFSSEMAVAVAAYLGLQAVDGNILSPLLFSEVVQLHPNAIIVAVLVFGGIWGFWGVFFAIPLATVANAVVRAWRDRTQDLVASAVGEANTPPL
ncbi:AI-2E family transporter [Eilatimonas milleporae]|uniref:Putative permease n=1 Tax=Eilatimonas milleporae TaxID=911205 RepID=A0A3M0C2K8_9PROT|nr:AI-2E family transporter [Eilatimonas milleporae]RMB02897.1 putative permease [Eilatimonas milleporae]